LSVYLVLAVFLFFFFFFSSRRRHTRFSRDWSSDVCSSDLGFGDGMFYLQAGVDLQKIKGVARGIVDIFNGTGRAVIDGFAQLSRSEERRVGKECGSGWSPEQYRRNR